MKMYFKQKYTNKIEQKKLACVLFLYCFKCFCTCSKIICSEITIEKYA